MKINDAKSKILANSIICLIFFLIAGFLYFYSLHIDKNRKIEISAIESQAQELDRKAEDYKSKISDTRKYREIWLTIPENKKNLNGINVDEMNDTLKSLALKYSISNDTIKISIPTKLNNGFFDKKTTNLLYTSGTINFKSLDDVSALNFLVDFVDSMIGYITLTSVDISKTKDYSNEDLIAISTGKEQGLITTKVEFIWYFYKEKSETK